MIDRRILFTAAAAIVTLSFAREGRAEDCSYFDHQANAMRTNLATFNCRDGYAVAACEGQRRNVESALRQYEAQARACRMRASTQKASDDARKTEAAIKGTTDLATGLIRNHFDNKRREAEDEAQRRRQELDEQREEARLERERLAAALRREEARQEARERYEAELERQRIETARTKLLLEIERVQRDALANLPNEITVARQICATDGTFARIMRPDLCGALGVEVVPVQVVGTTDASTVTRATSSSHEARNPTPTERMPSPSPAPPLVVRPPPPLNVVPPPRPPVLRRASSAASEEEPSANRRVEGPPASSAIRLAGQAVGALAELLVGRDARDNIFLVGKVLDASTERLEREFDNPEVAEGSPVDTADSEVVRWGFKRFFPRVTRKFDYVRKALETCQRIKDRFETTMCQ